MTARYDPVLVTLSFVIVVGGAYTALDLARRVRADAGPARIAWLTASAASLALAIWAMHFVAMLALDVGTPIRYDPVPTFLSLLGGIVATSLAFFVMGSGRAGWRRTLLAGGLMGLGICVVHFLGMGAMRASLRVVYDVRLVVLSAVVATGVATGALLLVSRVHSFARQAAGAVVLGAGVCAMHYTAMFAAHFSLCAAPEPPKGVPVAWISAGTLLGAAMVFVIGLLAAFYDRRIERMAARQTFLLRQKEEQLARILEHLPLGVRVVDAMSHEVVYVNREAERILGPAAAHASPSADEAPDDPLVRVLRDHAVVEREIRHPPSITEQSIEVSAAPILDGHGRMVCAVAAFQDVSARLRAEADLRQVQKIDSIGQITGGIAHDMNNLLTAILGNLDLLETRLGDEGAEQLGLLRNAIAATERGARLTGQLLGFSRRQALQRVDVDVNAAVRGMSDLLSRTLGDNVEIRTETTEAAWKALADPTQLEVVLLNLAINARDAMPHGGTIRIATENVTACDCTALGVPVADYVCVSVRDTGTGMDRETLARAFEPFFTTKPPGRGSGLGLSQVLGVCRQLGGDVTIESEAGHGTIVRVFLPRSTEAEQARRGPRADTPLAVAGLQGKSVLLVDDDLDAREATRALLVQLGCGVISVSTGRAAIAELRLGASIDAVVMDYGMPGMTGREAAERLLSIRPDLPILIITGYADPDMLAQIEERCHVLLKPFRAAALAASLGAILEPPAPPARVFDLRGRYGRAARTPTIAGH